MAAWRASRSLGCFFVAGKIPRHEHDRVRKDLVNYCERDTWAMVKLLEKLETLSRT